MPGTPAQIASPHKRALLLTATLFLAFLVVTGLYARYGYAFALRVFEQQQLANAELRKGSGKLVEYEDYLRVDPTNLYVRGVLVNVLIGEFQNPWRALETAQEGVAAVPPDQQPLARLLVARAQLACSTLDEAEQTYNAALTTLGKSGEAHYGLAHIAAARGDFPSMRSFYDSYRMELFENVDELDLGSVSIGFIPSNFTPIGTTPDFAHRLGKNDFDTSEVNAYTSTLLHERFGNIDEAFKLVADIQEFTGAPPFVIFLRGAFEEEQARPEAALAYYRHAADVGDVLGQFAIERLTPKDDEAESEE